jgi:hypothetical protein
MNVNQRTVATGLIVFGLILVVIAIFYPFIDQMVQDSNAIPLPEQIAGAQLVASAKGTQAVDEITRMHGKDFKLADGARGSYGQNNEITIWVSGSVSEDAAGQLVVEMRDKIAEGKSPFTPIGEKPIGGRTVYELEGTGQVHYYFQSGDKVIWLAVNSNLAEDALAQTLDYYP